MGTTSVTRSEPGSCNGTEADALSRLRLDQPTNGSSRKKRGCTLLFCWSAGEPASPSRWYSFGWSTAAA